MLSKDKQERNQKLLERLTVFTEKVIVLCGKLPRTVVNLPMISQLVKAATSIGANYHEACEAESSKDFVHKLGIAKKEGKETSYWLRLLLTPTENTPYREELINLRNEGNEYILIFSSIISKFRN